MQRPGLLLPLFIGTILGAIAGAMLLAPFLGKGPTDPAAESIGAGLGGLAGLAFGWLAFVMLRRQREKS